MGKFDLYKVSLKGVQPDIQEFEYNIDAAFFKAIDAPEVSKGTLHVTLIVKQLTERFEFRFQIDGVVQVPCDRCLDDIDLPISVKELLYVKFGNEYADDGDNMITIPEGEGEINVAWFLYEFIALQIPVKHVHPSGECNKEMLCKLKKYRVVDEEEDLDEEESSFDEDTLMDDDKDEDIDPRWGKLKNIIDNN